MNYVTKRKLLIPILCLLFNCKAISQRLDSSTCIPNYQLRVAVRLIEQGRIDSAIVVKQDSIIHLQKERIAKKDAQLLGYVNNEKTYQQLIAQYKKQDQLRDQAAGIASQWITSLQKQVKRERTKTVLVGIAGLIVSGVITYLAVK